MSPITNNTPKPLVKVNGTPFIKYLIEYLRSYGITNIILLTGYLGDEFDSLIEEYKDISGISVRKLHSEPDFNTSKRVQLSKEIISGDVLVCYGDVYSEVNLTSYYNFYKSLKPSSTSISALSRHIKLNKIQIYDSNLPLEKKYKDIGFIGIEAKYLKENLSEDIDMKFEDWVFNSNLNHKIYLDDWLYNSLTDKNALESFSKQLTEKVTLILDRDGVINHKLSKGNYVKNLESLKLNFSFIELLKKNKSSFERVVILTNQPWISNNQKNYKLHNKIKKKLKKLY